MLREVELGIEDSVIECFFWVKNIFFIVYFGVYWNYDGKISFLYGFFFLMVENVYWKWDFYLVVFYTFVGKRNLGYSLLEDFRVFYWGYMGI